MITTMSWHCFVVVIIIMTWLTIKRTVLSINSQTTRNVIVLSNVFHYKCNSLVWNWSDTILSAMWTLISGRFSSRVGVNSIISTPTPTPTPEVSTPTPTPANLQNINSNSNSNSGGFNSNSNSNSGRSSEYQLQLQLRRFQFQLQFQLRRLQLQFQPQLRSFKSKHNSISNPINLIHLNYHYPITMWNIVWTKWSYAVDICHAV